MYDPFAQPNLPGISHENAATTKRHPKLDHTKDTEQGQVLWGLQTARLTPSDWRADTSAPAGEAVVGWRVGVYWANDAVFYYGDIIQHEPLHNRFADTDS